MSDRTLTIYCGFLMAITAFSIDITLPFFGILRETLQTSNEAVSATVTLNILGLGVGQMVFGSIADRYGRRRAVAIGLGIYLAAALAAALAPTIQWLLAARVVQGLGAGAAPVVARAMIRDRFTGARLGQNMAIASGIFSVGPIAAPLCGALLIELGGSWRVLFGAMSMLAIILLLVLTRTPETLAERRLDALSPAGIAANVRAVYANPQSRFFLLLASCAMATIVMIVSGMARVMESAFGVTGTMFAILFGLHGSGIIVGQFLNHWLIGRFGIVPAATTGALIISSAFLGIVVCAALDFINAIGFAIGVTGFAVGYLMVFANSASMTLEPHGRRAGFTAAFFGAHTQLVGAVLAAVLVTLAGGRLIPWSMAVLGLCVATLVSLVVWQRHPTSRKTVQPS